MALALDAAEWHLIFGALISALSFSLFMAFTILIKVAFRVHWSWYWLSGFFGSTFVVSIIYLIEPRPSHWLPSLNNITRTTGRCNPKEWMARARRWWQWRKKYESQRKTKLNV